MVSDAVAGQTSAPLSKLIPLLPLPAAAAAATAATTNNNNNVR